MGIQELLCCHEPQQFNTATTACNKWSLSCFLGNDGNNAICGIIRIFESSGMHLLASGLSDCSAPETEWSNSIIYSQDSTLDPSTKVSSEDLS